MKTRPIVAATRSFNADGVPFSEIYQDVYHPQAGAFTQARHVFLQGNELPQRWQVQEKARERFVILETGFGLGNNFLATWQAWRDDPERCERLVFVSIEQSPFTADDLRRMHRVSPAPQLMAQLVDAWPPLTHDLHRLSFEEGRVQLLLAFGDAELWLPELVMQVDAFYLDGFAPARNPRLWQPSIFKALARLAAPQATLATWTAASEVRSGLQSAGFDVRKAQGRGGKRDITLARYAPTFAPRHAPSRSAMPSPQRRALIVGGGLAGCATASALADQGWRSTVFDRHATPAQETSGNPAGLFHGIVNAQDGTHARFNRAAAFHAQHEIARHVARGAVPGAVEGLLRLDDADPSEMVALLAALGLPHDYVRAVDANEASALAGMPLDRSAWFYPGGGWADPGALSQAWLQSAAPFADFRGSVEVHHLHRDDSIWQLLGQNGEVIDEADVVVLANADGALRLIDQPEWPIDTVRGQITLLDRTQAPGLTLPKRPVAGSGYLLPEVNGQAVFGATSQPGDRDASVRASDHAANLAQLARLTGIESALPTSAVQGRVGWRCVAQDKLPVIGAVPNPDSTLSGARPMDQPRFVPRMEGLFVFTALGSRGITWSTLGARALAALITGAPSPLGSSLLDAVDPARFTSRAVRRGSSASRVAGGRG